MSCDLFSLCFPRFVCFPVCVLQHRKTLFNTFLQVGVQDGLAALRKRPSVLLFLILQVERGG